MGAQSSCFNKGFMPSAPSQGLNESIRLIKESIGGIVSGPVVRPADKTHARFIMNGYLLIKHGRG